MSNNPTALVPFLLQRIIPAIKASGNTDAQQAFEELFRIISASHRELVPLVERARVIGVLDEWAISKAGYYSCGPIVAHGSGIQARCALVLGSIIPTPVTVLQMSAATASGARSLVAKTIEAGEV